MTREELERQYGGKKPRKAKPSRHMPRKGEIVRWYFQGQWYAVKVLEICDTYIRCETLHSDWSLTGYVYRCQANRLYRTGERLTVSDKVYYDAR